jgi:hypothetical protein
MAQAGTEKSKLTQAVASATGKMWCGYHQGHADASSGSYQQRNGKRFMCAACMKLRGIEPA